MNSCFFIWSDLLLDLVSDFYFLVYAKSFLNYIFKSQIYLFLKFKYLYKLHASENTVEQFTLLFLNSVDKYTSTMFHSTCYLHMLLTGQVVILWILPSELKLCKARIVHYFLRIIFCNWPSPGSHLKIDFN
ncbi:hypothetical protein DFJ63DRAFT_143440 [Scheffersomyces coipomensis]|uniref:uncharacterized protein n=1 Tax=Scheffersomyces coipomensis TaxID=1788519 RepID=UPI00315CC7A6